MPGGGGREQCLADKKFSKSRNDEENCFSVLGGSGGMLPRKIFKIKGPRLATNGFPAILAWKI